MAVTLTKITDADRVLAAREGMAQSEALALLAAADGRMAAFEQYGASYHSHALAILALTGEDPRPAL